MRNPPVSVTELANPDKDIEKMFGGEPEEEKKPDPSATSATTDDKPVDPATLSEEEQQKAKKRKAEEVQKKINAAVRKNSKGYGTSAYMLIYRKVDPTNMTSVSPNDIPQDIREFVAKENDHFLAAKEKAKLRKDTIALRVFSSLPDKTDPKATPTSDDKDADKKSAPSKTIFVHKDEPLTSAVKAALEEYDLKEFPVERARLRYSSFLWFPHLVPANTTCSPRVWVPPLLEKSNRR